MQNTTTYTNRSRVFGFNLVSTVQNLVGRARDLRSICRAHRKMWSIKHALKPELRMPRLGSMIGIPPSIRAL